MTKKPRPSINDQLAKIAAQAPAQDAPLSGGGLPRDNVAPPRAEEPAEPAMDPRTDPKGPARFNNRVRRSPLKYDPATDGRVARIRFEKPHASIYAHPNVFKALREIAAAQDCKVHDLFAQGLRFVLRQHGRDFDKLNRGG